MLKSFSGPGYWPSTERHRGSAVPHAGRHHCPTIRTVVLPVRRGTQQATEQLGGALNQLSVPSASTAVGASGCSSVRLAYRGPSPENLRAARHGVVFRCPILLLPHPYYWRNFVSSNKMISKFSEKPKTDAY